MWFEEEPRPAYPAYRQCKLKRLVASAGKGSLVEYTTSYLPDEGLAIGAQVRFRDTETDPWSEGWIIDSMGEPTEGKLVEDVLSTSWERTRKFSDR